MTAPTSPVQPGSSSLRTQGYWWHRARADLLGADLRDADVRGTDLSAALFLTQPQVNAMVGDAATTLPEGLSRPARWAS